MLLFWSIRAHLEKLFLLHESISVSSHPKLADAKYLKLNMFELTCQGNRKFFFLDVTSIRNICQFSQALCYMISLKIACIESYAK